MDGSLRVGKESHCSLPGFSLNTRDGLRAVTRGLTVKTPWFIEVQAIEANETVPLAAGRRRWPSRLLHGFDYVQAPVFVLLDSRVILRRMELADVRSGDRDRASHGNVRKNHAD